MKKNKLVVKHNSLIRSRYDYTLAELRLVITVASMIEAKDEDFRKYVVPAQEYAELMGADDGNTYRYLQKLGEMLLSKPLKIDKEDGFLMCNWFSSYEYNRGKGTLSVSFDPKLKPYLLRLKEQFTKYKLENILKFKSAYSIRLYEIFKSWEGAGGFTISIDELRELLGLEKKYSKYADFKRWVIERSLKEINSLSDIRVTYREKKLGRKVTDLVFDIKPNRPADANYLKSEKAFRAYMRAHYAGETLISNVKTRSGKVVDIAISTSGNLYNARSADDFTKKEAERLWKWLYELAKKGELPILRQTTIDDFD